MTATVFYHSTLLPWTVSPQEEARFRRILLAVFGTVLLASLIIPLLPVPAPSEQDAVAVPPRFAKLIMQERPKPPPPPPVVEKPEPKPEPEKAVEKPPEPEIPKPQPREEKVAVPTPPPPSAREKAARSGLLALRDELADLRTDTVAEALEKQPLRKSATAEPAAGDTTRSIITSQVASGSGGINTSRLSRDTGGTQLAGRETTRVTAPVDETVSARGPTESAAGKTGPLPARSSEEIQVIFDRNKGTLNAIYNRALRQNPALAGKVVLKLTIAPDGTVSQCELVSSELDDPELERKLIARVQLFDFGQKSAAATTITYPIDFFPG